jgi:hypothetical protein
MILSRLILIMYILYIKQNLGSKQLQIIPNYYKWYAYCVTCMYVCVFFILSRKIFRKII